LSGRNTDPREIKTADFGEAIGTDKKSGKSGMETGKTLNAGDQMTKKQLFLANLRGEYTTRVPVWMMRQAGRYMREYREIRARHSFEEICKTPQLAAEVTAQPIEAFGPDAAIIFSDILFIVEPLGFNLAYEPGPVITPLLSHPNQITQFEIYDPKERLAFVGEAIIEAKKRLGDDLPMIGFCGGPFTVFCFLCGAKGAREYDKAYKFMANYPDLTIDILEMLTELSLQYLRMQIEAGADYIQIFDTLAGELSEEEFNIWAMPYLVKIAEGLKAFQTPSGLYIKNSNHLLDSIRRIRVDCVSLDWKTKLDRAVNKLVPKSLQGNLNPYLLLGRSEIILQTAEKILRTMESYPGYIFNLGHGVVPDTPVENVRALIQFVQSFERNRGA
jgi:uroporphyrinogen decarboxylase